MTAPTPAHPAEDLFTIPPEFNFYATGDDALAGLARETTLPGSSPGALYYLGGGTPTASADPLVHQLPSGPPASTAAFAGPTPGLAFEAGSFEAKIEEVQSRLEQIRADIREVQTESRQLSASNHKLKTTVDVATSRLRENQLMKELLVRMRKKLNDAVSPTEDAISSEQFNAACDEEQGANDESTKRDHKQFQPSSGASASLLCSGSAQPLPLHHVASIRSCIIKLQRQLAAFQCLQLQRNAAGHTSSSDHITVLDSSLDVNFNVSLKKTVHDVLQCHPLFGSPRSLTGTAAGSAVFEPHLVD